MKLTMIAADMKASVNRHHTQIFDRRTLDNGLELLLHRHTPYNWCLALARMETYPSDIEISTCMKAFGVPKDTEINRRLIPTYHGTTRKQKTLYIAEMIWDETT